MKRAVLLLCALMAVAAAGQENERILFPKSTFGGHMDFELAPPHNEWDLNRCDAHAGVGGGPSRISIVAAHIRLE